MQKAKVRLYLNSPIEKGMCIPLSTNQLHYLTNVMRSESCTIFNGCDGEWLARLEKKFLVVIGCLCEQKVEQSAIALCFSIIKKPAITTLIRQATEFGINHIQPVYTEFTAARDFNKEKLTLQAIEGAEQCKRLSLPTIMDPINFIDVLSRYENLVALNNKCANKPEQIFKNMEDVTLFIGPEGGFSYQEIQCFLAKKVAMVNLGENILRSETAFLVSAAYAKILMQKSAVMECDI